MSKPKTLNPKQELFVIEYAKDFNATQAAIRAGYSAKNADKIGPRLVGKCREVIESRKAEMKKTGIATLEQSLRLCTALAFYDPGQLYDKHDNPKEVSEIDKLHRKAIAGFEVEELYDGKGEGRKKIGYVRKYKMADRAPYVNMLLKFHGAFPSKQLPPPPSSSGPRFDTSNWTEEDWEAFKRLRNKSKLPVVQ